MVDDETCASVSSLGGGSKDVDRMCRELFWEVEQKLIKHKLAKDYYGFRAFWLQCLPLLLMTTFITIIAFIEYGHMRMNDDEYAVETRQRLVLSLGILGLLSTILTSLMINTRYQSQRDMHAMAERTLAKVCQLVRFPERIPGDNGGTKLMEQINKQKAIVVSIECISSNVPPRIEHAFRDLEHTMKMKPYTFRAIQYERFYYALWKMMTKRSYGGKYSNLWPLLIPEIDISRSVLGNVIEEEFGKYNQGVVAVRRKSSAELERKNSLMLMNGGSIANGSIRTNCSNNTRRTEGLGNSNISTELSHSIMNHDDTIDSSNTMGGTPIRRESASDEEEQALMSSTTSLSSTTAEGASFSLFEMLWYTKQEIKAES